LDVAALRQEAIASNMANADTPGYRRVDVAPDFERQLKAQVAAGNVARNVGSLRPLLAEDAMARSLRPDGNNVEIERELLAMNRNAMEYDFLSDIVSGNLKRLKSAITGQA
jgi:flagellar basal-body rod protein FlgB